MKDAFSKGITLGLGMAASSKEQAEKVVKELLKKGEITREESDHVFAQWKQKGEESKQQADEKIKQQLKRWLTELEVVKKEEVTELEQRIIQLENRVRELEEE
ncbi:phasin family protein [Gracilibacillus salinarum]|uniref:Polyhydroxyalkanoate synthesis regulator n=1 Tax=Gracilibacillus salinarum TaxID=2932255 RepID=A0ABY4GGA9_9BACI|nr:polyhydroxyalkanoate synthesis regulator [Gracilibacillus salinarum]UOQ83351.1 polyhydroxyalkanoate synthesis regulator [Gracilibacillus salinarum]